MNYFDSEVFESNDLNIEGNILKKNITNIYLEFETLFEEIFTNDKDDCVNQDKNIDIIDNHINIDNDLSNNIENNKQNSNTTNTKLEANSKDNNIEQIMKNLR